MNLMQDSVGTPPRAFAHPTKLLLHFAVTTIAQYVSSRFAWSCRVAEIIAKLRVSIAPKIDMTSAQASNQRRM